MEVASLGSRAKMRTKEGGKEEDSRAEWSLRNESRVLMKESNEASRLKQRGSRGLIDKGARYARNHELTLARFFPHF